MTLGEGAYVGGLAGVHQFVHIGRLVMIAGLTGVRQDVPPYLWSPAHKPVPSASTPLACGDTASRPMTRRALREAFRVFLPVAIVAGRRAPGLDSVAGTSPPVAHFRDFLPAPPRERNRGIVRWQPRQTDQ